MADINDVPRGPFDRVQPLGVVGAVPVFKPRDIANARRAYLATLDKWCTVMRPLPGTWGQSGDNLRMVGRYPCNVDLMRRETETNAGTNDATSTSETEINIALPCMVDIDPADRIGIPAWFGEWAPGVVTAKRIRIRPRALGVGEGPIFEALTAGTTGATEPMWPRVSGANVHDGGSDTGVLWKCVGRATYYEVIAVSDELSNQVRTVVRCKVLK